MHEWSHTHTHTHTHTYIYIYTHTHKHTHTHTHTHTHLHTHLRTPPPTTRSFFHPFFSLSLAQGTPPIVTPGYQLPSKMVLHVTGPRIANKAGRFLWMDVCVCVYMCVC